jgi:thioesterase domain-containing protein
MPNQSRSGSGWQRVYWPGGDFQPPRFQAPVLLFKRPKQPYYYIRDPQMGWGERTLGGVEVCEIDCGHVEMLREPYVGIVAEKIAGRMASADQEQPLVTKPTVESVDGASLAQQSVA